MLGTQKETKDGYENVSKFSTTQLGFSIIFRSVEESEQHQKSFWESLSKKILNQVTPQLSLVHSSGVQHPYGSRIRGKELLTQNISSNQDLPKSQNKLRQGYRNPSNNKIKNSKRQITPESADKLPRKQTIKFTRTTKTRSTKYLFPNRFEGGYNGPIKDETGAFESYFKRKPSSKYLVPSETPLPQIGKIFKFKHSRSMYELVVEHLLDRIVLDEEKNDNNPNTMASLDEKVDLKSRQTSMIFDLDTKSQGNTMKKQSGNKLANSKTFDRLESQNQLFESKIKKISGEIYIRRKSCSCKDCGLNKKLAKASILKVPFNTNFLTNDSCLPKIDITTPVADSKSKNHLQKTQKNRSPMRASGLLNQSNRPSGSLAPGQTGPINQYLGTSKILNLSRTPVNWDPIFLHYQRRRSSVSLRDSSVMSRTSNSPSPSSEMKIEAANIFLLKATQSCEGENSLQQSSTQREKPKIPLNNQEEHKKMVSHLLIDDWERKNNNKAAKLLRIEEKPTEYNVSPLRIKPKAKNTFEFSRLESSDPLIVLNSTNGDLVDNDSQNIKDTNPTKRKTHIQRTLAQIISRSQAFESIDQPLSLKSPTNPNRSKDNSTNDLNSSSKLLNRSIRQVLLKTGQHSGLLASMNKTKRKDKKSVKKPKGDLSLPYILKPNQEDSIKYVNISSSRTRDFVPQRQRPVISNEESKSYYIRKDISLRSSSNLLSQNLGDISNISKQYPEYKIETNLVSTPKDQQGDSFKNFEKTSELKLRKPNRPKNNKVSMVESDRVIRLNLCYQKKTASKH